MLERVLSGLVPVNVKFLKRKPLPDEIEFDILITTAFEVFLRSYDILT